VTRETARVEAFSAGVFAIAITLLTLEIRVPHLPLEAGDPQLGAALRALWPSFLTFAGTFGAILTMWINQHGFFDLLERVDRRFLHANGLLLLLITFVPFPMALLRFPVHLLAVVVALCSVLWICWSGLDNRVRHALPARP
jgi:uncharacterized membrane protein